MKENGVSRALADTLRSNTTLRELNLWYNEIRDGGAQALAAALAAALIRNTTLTSLELQCNEVGPAGRQALAEAMLLNTTLRELDIIGILPGQFL